MKISGPQVGSKSVREYQAISRAADYLPTEAVWVAQTKQAGKRDPLMTQIDQCLAFYDKAKDGWDRLALLGQLYFACDYYLKRAPGVAPKPQGESAVNRLFLTVVDKLCKAFNCTVNFLPQMLEECWGRVLTPHGHELDTRGVATGAPSTIATYLTRAQALKYKLSFRDGKAYMRDRQKFTTWVLANSAAIGWTHAPGITGEMMEKGYAGFALSMGREFFMAHHRGGFAKGNFFHSSYLGGDSVLCTGTLQIENGIVKAVANDSGHYQPSRDHLLNVVQALQMRGCNLSQLAVWSAPKSWKDNKGVVQNAWGYCTGTELMQSRGGGYGLYQRMESNQANIARRTGGAPGQVPVVNLPGPNRRPPPPPPRRF
jgi:hypothetical protein